MDFDRLFILEGSFSVVPIAGSPGSTMLEVDNWVGVLPDKDASKVNFLVVPVSNLRILVVIPSGLFGCFFWR